MEFSLKLLLNLVIQWNLFPVHCIVKVKELWKEVLGSYISWRELSLFGN